MNTSAQIWLGTEDSCYSTLTLLSRYLEDPTPYESRVNLFVGEDDEGGPTFVEMLADEISTDYGNVRVIDVNGPMVTQAGFMDLFGGTSYQTIATALSKAVEADHVEEVVLSLNTPGGSADGIFDLADTIKEVGALKPVTA